MVVPDKLVEVVEVEDILQLILFLVPILILLTKLSLEMVAQVWQVLINGELLGVLVVFLIYQLKEDKEEVRLLVVQVGMVALAALVVEAVEVLAVMAVQEEKTVAMEQQLAVPVV